MDTSFIARSQNELKRRLSDQNLNKRAIAKLLKDITDANMIVRIQTQTKDRDLYCDGPLCLASGQLMKESQMVRPYTCYDHILCPNCFIGHIQNKLVENPFAFNQINCPRCEVSGFFRVIHTDLIYQHFTEQVLIEYQKWYIQRMEEFSQGQIFQIVEEKIGLDEVEEMDKPPLYEEISIGDLTAPPSPDDMCKNAKTFINCFKTLKATLDNSSVKLLSTQKITLKKAK